MPAQASAATPAPSLVRYLGTQLLDLAFPPHCLHCGTFGRWLCEPAQQAITELPTGWCGRCGRIAAAASTLCRRCARQLRLRRLRALFAYDGVVEQVVLAAKFQGATIGFASLLALADPILIPSNTLLVPLPASAHHEQRRGYNQAVRLTSLLAAHTGATVFDQLNRVRAARPQVGLSAADRWTNAEGLYAWTGDSLTGRHCLLVDDVTTSGASLASAAAALRAAGARGIDAFVLAQTPLERD